jgi:MSHA biogenesis protein MshL
VVKSRDGQVIVIGGLMTETSGDDRAAIPGLGDVPVAGALFRRGSQASSKRELVILIRPTVVKSDVDWSDDIASTGRRLQGMGTAGPAH